MTRVWDFLVVMGWANLVFVGIVSYLIATALVMMGRESLAWWFGAVANLSFFLFLALTGAIELWKASFMLLVAIGCVYLAINERRKEKGELTPSSKMKSAMRVGIDLPPEGGASAGNASASQDDSLHIVPVRLSAEFGIPKAQYLLGTFYMHGKGVPQDYIAAHMWFNLAASGSTDAQFAENAAKYREMLSARMTAEQVADAQKLAREWVPRLGASGDCW